MELCRRESFLILRINIKKISEKKRRDGEVELSDKRKRWRVLGNSQTTLIAVSLERSCGWEEARGAVAVTAALWPRPGKSCVSTCVCVTMPGWYILLSPGCKHCHLAVSCDFQCNRMSMCT